MRLVHVYDSDPRNFQRSLDDIVKRCERDGEHIASVEHAIAAVRATSETYEATFYSAVIAIVPKPTLKPPRGERADPGLSREPGPGERDFNELFGPGQRRSRTDWA